MAEPGIVEGLTQLGSDLYNQPSKPLGQLWESYQSSAPGLGIPGGGVPGAMTSAAGAYAPRVMQLVNQMSKAHLPQFGQQIIRDMGTPEEAEARRHMETYFPKILEALKRHAQEFRLRMNPELGKGVGGRTDWTKGAPIDIQFGRQAGPETFAHEPLHALYGAKGELAGQTPNAAQMNVPKKHAISVLVDKGRTPLNFAEDYLSQALYDPAHAAIYRLADTMAHKQGYVPTPFTSVIK